MKKSFVILSMAVCSALAMAEDASKNIMGNDSETTGILQNADPAVTKKAMQRAEEYKKQMMGVDINKLNPDTLKTFQGAARMADDVADETVQQNRKEIAQFLGIDPNGRSGIFYFVSWSMPVELIRSYIVDAMWSGGSVIFKGIPKGRDLGDFITQDLQALVYGKSSANIAIDPRLFDRYDVKAVPAIVVTSNKENFDCKGYIPKTFEAENGQMLQYDECPAADPSTYYKITGSVTGSYALQAMVDAGADYAQPFLHAIQKGWADGKAPPKDQSVFVGKWETVLTPEQLKAIENAKQSAGVGEIK